MFWALHQGTPRTSCGIDKGFLEMQVFFGLLHIPMKYLRLISFCLIGFVCILIRHLAYLHCHGCC